jgi:ABC-2 type transport system permease protein
MKRCLTVWALIKKDFRINKTYRLKFIFNCASILVNIVFFYFISSIFGNNLALRFSVYAGRYFSFVFVGIVLWGYLVVSLKNFTAHIREEQIGGALEIVLSAPLNSSTFIISAALVNFAPGFLGTLVYLLFGAFFLNLHFSIVYWAIIVLILFLTTVVFAAIGIILAGLIMLFKKADPAVWLVSVFFAFFGGVYFPPEVLPKNLQLVSGFTPLIYALSALRKIFFEDYNFEGVSGDILVLFLFGAILLPLALFFFKYTIRRVKLTSSLAHY